MANPLQMAGAQLPPSDFAPLHVNRMMTGMWPNTNPLRDASTPNLTEKYFGGNNDSLCDGVNAEISTRLTLIRRPGSTVYNSKNFPPINRFYGWNTFTQTDEAVRVMVDTQWSVYDGTGPDTQEIVWSKSVGSGSTYFLGVGNTLYFTNGVDNKQLNNATGVVTNWGIAAPPTAPLVSQQPRPNPYPAWSPNTAYGIYNAARAGTLILDNPASVVTNFSIIPLFAGGGTVAIGCGQGNPNGAAITLPPGFNTTNMLIWTTPCEGFNNGVQIAGVYQSTGGGGVTNSTFQNRSGGSGFIATTNWIALAWTPGSPVTVTTAGGYSTIVFRTVVGDDIAFVFGTGADQTAIPVPPGYNTTNMAWMAGPTGTVNTGNGMQIVRNCQVNIGPPPTIACSYTDNQGNIWSGTAGVMMIFWLPTGRVLSQPANNCTGIIIPVSATTYQVLLFAANLPPFTNFGVSGRDATAMTAAMSGAAPGGAGNNVAHGYSVTVSGGTFIGSYQDGSGNTWDGYGNGFSLLGIDVPYNGNVEVFNGEGTTGSAEPSPWNPAVGGITADGTVNWTNLGPFAWVAGATHSIGDVVMATPTSPPGIPAQFFVCTTPGVSGSAAPNWVGSPGLQVADGPTVVWTNQGAALTWGNIGPNTNITAATAIVDDNGYLQTVISPGVTGSSYPAFSTQLGATTQDGGVTWLNAGPFSVANTAPTQYGNAFASTDAAGDFIDISNMSPASAPITVIEGNQVTIQGYGSGDPQVTTIVLYRTDQGGAIFFFLASFPNPGAGQLWTYVDTIPDSGLNIEIQAQVDGEGTPLPAGATCLAYHLGRIFAAVGNVVWVSSGPDAIASGSSGNAGFDTTFTCQSRIIRFWVVPQGVIVLTVGDSYLIQGSATPSSPLYISTWIENLPLLNYDAFTVLYSTGYLFGGQRMVTSLDPSAGINEVSFPVAPNVAAFNPATAYCTFHIGGSGETALYLADGASQWYRMAPTSPPETGTNWSPKAVITGGMSALQSTEILPGTLALLIGPAAPGGPILMRDMTVNSDNGTPYPMSGIFNPIVLATPGQLAGLAWMSLKDAKTGNTPQLGVLLDEIGEDFETVSRTRQDPPNLPPSTSLESNRYSLMQNQKPVWCQTLKFSLEWPETDTPDELFTYTIFGQTWAEQRSQ